MYKVYLISSGEIDKQYKIGFTRREVKERLKEFKTGNSNTLEIVSVFESKWGTKIEAILHRRYRNFQIDGEWFNLDEKQVKEFYQDCKKQHDLFELVNNHNTYVIERGGLK